MFTGRVVDLHLQWVKLSSANPLPGSKTNFTFLCLLSKLKLFNKFHFFKSKAQTVECKSHVTEHKFQIAEYINLLLNVRVIC